jgi:TorA maturation chaperone TorD
VDHLARVWLSPAQAVPSRAASEPLPLLASGASPNRRSQLQVFEDRVAPWMPQFFGDLEAAPSARFYAAVGTLGRCFIDIEAAATGMCGER